MSEPDDTLWHSFAQNTHALHNLLQDAVATVLPPWSPLNSWPTSPPTAPPAIPGGCYEASFGWVHVRPGCRCPR